MDIKEAAKCLDKSEKTIRRWIEAGRLKAALIKGKYEIESLDILDIQMSKQEKSNMSNLSNELVGELKAQLAELRKDKKQWEQERAELQKQIVELQAAADESNRKHDNIVLQLTQQLEQSQRIQEAYQEPWYRRKPKKRKDGDNQT